MSQRGQGGVELVCKEGQDWLAVGVQAVHLSKLAGSRAYGADAGKGVGLWWEPKETFSDVASFSQ